jgi:hypothetical protein
LAATLTFYVRAQRLIDFLIKPKAVCSIQAEKTLRI